MVLGKLMCWKMDKNNLWAGFHAKLSLGRKKKPCSLDIRPIFNVQNDFMSMRRNSSSQKEALGGHGSGNRRPSSFGAEDFAGLFEDADFLGA